LGILQQLKEFNVRFNARNEYIICKGALLIDEISNAIIQNEDDPPYVLSIVVASFPFEPNASPRR
jgi:hypothetical protein